MIVVAKYAKDKSQLVQEPEGDMVLNQSQGCLNNVLLTETSSVGRKCVCWPKDLKNIVGESHRHFRPTFSAKIIGDFGRKSLYRASNVLVNPTQVFEDIGHPVVRPLLITHSGQSQ